MPFPDQYPLVDHLTTVSASDINDIYEIIGLGDPAGAYDTIEDRLDAIQAAIESGPPVDPTLPPAPQTIPAPPATYTGVYSEDFLNDNYTKANGGRFDLFTGVHSNDSYDVTTNITRNVDENFVRLGTTAVTTSGSPYSSASMGTGGSGTDAQRYFPLFGLYEAMVRFPMTHAHQAGITLNYRNSGVITIKGFEINNAENPGFANIDVSCTRPGYAAKMIASNSPTYGTTTWPSYVVAAPSGNNTTGVTGTLRSGNGVAWDDPKPILGVSDFHKVGIEIAKVNGAVGGWTADFKFYLDDQLVCTWRDTITDYNNGAVPSWYTPGFDGVTWDIQFHNWVGGNEVGDAWNGSARIHDYNGFLGDGTTFGFQPETEVPNATKWLTDETKVYGLDVAWVRVATAPSLPGPDEAPAIPALPTGHTLAYLQEFSDNTFKSGQGGDWTTHTTHQGGSVSGSSNSTFYSQGGVMRMVANATPNGGQPYTSAYPRSNNNGSFYPLFGKYEAAQRVHYRHSLWTCMWINYRGSAGSTTSGRGFEIDIAESAPSTNPGRGRMVTHCVFATAQGRPEYGTNGTNLSNRVGTRRPFPNDPNYTARSRGAGGWNPLSLSPLVRSYSANGIDVDMADPREPPKWVIVGAEVKEIRGTVGWTMEVDWYIDGECVYRWRDPSDPNVHARPAWAADDNFDAGWDIRFDNWVGGTGDVGQAWDGTNYVYTYNGRQQGVPNTATGDLDWDNGAGMAVGSPLMLNADFGPSHTENYYMDVAWVRVTKAPPALPPPTTSILNGSLWNANITAGPGEAIGVATLSAFQATWTGSGQGTLTGAAADHLPTNGLNAMKTSVATASSNSYAEAFYDPSGTTDHASVYTRFFFRYDVAHSSNITVSSMRTAAGASVANLRLVGTGGGANAGKLQLTDPASTVAITSNTVLTPGQYYCVEYFVNNTSDQVGLRLRNGTTGAIISGDDQTASMAVASNIGRVSYGISTPNVATDLWFAYPATQLSSYIGSFQGA